MYGSFWFFYESFKYADFLRMICRLHCTSILIIFIVLCIYLPLFPPSNPSPVQVSISINFGFFNHLVHHHNTPIRTRNTGDNSSSLVPRPRANNRQQQPQWEFPPQTQTELEQHHWEPTRPEHRQLPLQDAANVEQPPSNVKQPF